MIVVVIVIRIIRVHIVININIIIICIMRIIARAMLMYNVVIDFGMMNIIIISRSRSSNIVKSIVMAQSCYGSCCCCCGVKNIISINKWYISWL